MGPLYEDQYEFFIISFSILKMKNVLDKRFREYQCTNFVIKFFFRKSCRLWDNVEKYGTARQATDDDISQAHCTPDT